MAGKAKPDRAWARAMMMGFGFPGATCSNSESSLLARRPNLDRESARLTSLHIMTSERPSSSASRRRAAACRSAERRCITSLSSVLSIRRSSCSRCLRLDAGQRITTSMTASQKTELLAASCTARAVPSSVPSGSGASMWGCSCHEPRNSRTRCTSCAAAAPSARAISRNSSAASLGRSLWVAAGS
eukprot:scaffold8799_cov30-Tisochrysis_lutea.AAC.3